MSLLLLGYAGVTQFFPGVVLGLSGGIDSALVAALNAHNRTHADEERIRLRMALELLRSRRGLTEIALDLGYTSHSHFTAAFRNYFGITPSRYRATS